MSENDEIYSVFAHEAREQLGALEEGLLAMEQGANDAETVNAIFRAAHTLKGASGVVELVHVEAFTHVMENLLDQVRNGQLMLSSEMISTLLKGCDHLGDLIDGVERGVYEASEELQQRGRVLMDALNAHSIAAPDVAGAAPASSELRPDTSGGAHSACWHISVRFGRDVLRNGMDPIAFLRFLLTLGEITHIETLADTMPPADDMDPESCYLGFEIDLQAPVDRAAIEHVFDFVRDECELHILPPNSQVNDYIRLIEGLPEDGTRLSEILSRGGAIQADVLQQGLSARHVAQDTTDNMATVPAATVQALAQANARPEPAQPQATSVESADTSSSKSKAPERKSGESRLIRVHADKLDQLIDLVGELVIAGASSSLLAVKSGQSQLVESTSVLSRLVENIRDAALQLRMVQIGETFNRFPRVVRDVAKEMGKDIELVINGADTELDKSVVEKIGDPLMHLVRNAMDHGIESAEQRLASGKPARGRLELNAHHDSGSIVIEVSDDGGGLNRDRILAKAVERGLVAQGQVLSDLEVHNLIFEAGFSTAEKVTNLSGRGVGMDVVRKNIQALRGSVDVQSVPGQGSRFSIRLPLTLAIIDGFLVGVGKAAYVIPLEMVVECLEGQSIGPERDYLDLRGEVLPFVRLRDMFAVPGAPPARQNVVVVKSATGKLGVVVDVLHGEFQTVIKPLSTLFRELRGIVGSTIMGSGEVALILDVQALAQTASETQGKTHPAELIRH